MTGEGGDGGTAGADAPSRTDVEYEDVPDWEDAYLDRVSDRLMFNYDLGRDERIRGERFDLTGVLRVENQRQFIHESINYANHRSEERLFARRANRVSVADLERLVDLGHDLAEDVDADERHYGTDFTFVLVVPEIPGDVRRFVTGFKDRTLIKFGYYGHYEVNLVVVAPDEEDVAASANADVAEAFATWRDPGERETRSLVGRVVGWLRS